MSGLYDGKEYFILILNGVETVIDEPLGFDVSQIVRPRDAQWYGFTSEYIDENTPLTFPPLNGGTFISENVDIFGCDINIYFQFGLITEAGARTPLFTGRLNLYDIDGDNPDGVTCPIERTSFENTFRSRYEVKVTATSDKDQDDNTIVPLTPMLMQLHSKEITKISLQDDGAPDGHSWVNKQTATIEDHDYNTVWLQIDTLSMKNEDLKSILHLPFGITLTDPVTRQANQYEALESGILEVFFAVYGILVGGTGGTATMFLSQVRGDTEIKQYTQALVVNPHGISDQEFGSTPDGGYTFNFLMEIGDKIYVGVKLDALEPNVLTYITINDFSNKISFKQYTQTPKTVVKCHRIFDILNQLVYSATGFNNRVISSYYGDGGPAEKRALLNGYQVRDYDTDNRPLQVDPSTVLTSLQAIDNIGVGYRNIAGDDYFIIEPMMFFFNRNVIATIRGAFDWRNKCFKEYIYNLLNIGYEKSADSDPTTIDEYMTEISTLFPVKNIAKTLSQKCKIIGSPYIMEKVRREQFKPEVSTSVTEDDDVFIICYTDQVIYKTVEYSPFVGDSTIYFGVDVGLEKDDVITLKDNVFNNNVSFTIVGRVPDISNWGYIVTPAPSAVTGGTELTTVEIALPTGYPSTPVVAERNEPFETVTGTVSPGTIYNGRITPKHNAYNWAPLLHIGSIYQADAVKIKTTFAKTNGLLATEFKASEPNPGFVGTDVIQENADIQLGDYSGRIRPFTPNGSTFKAPVSAEIADLIAKALSGELGDAGKDHGCIVVEDDAGVEWLMAIMNFTYAAESEIGTFDCAKIEKY